MPIMFSIIFGNAFFIVTPESLMHTKPKAIRAKGANNNESKVLLKAMTPVSIRKITPPIVTTTTPNVAIPSPAEEVWSLLADF